MYIPKVFVGGSCPEAFISWAENIDDFILHNQVPSRERLPFSISLLRGEAKAWWRLEEEARLYEEEPIHTWDELKITMSYRYIPGFQWEETEPPYSPPETPLPTVAADKEGETQVLYEHVPDQTKKEKGVFGESSTASELALALVDQGESIKTLTCGLLTRFTLYLQVNFVGYLWIVKGLQHVVFEPGGNLCVIRIRNNILFQKAPAFKLNLEVLFTFEEHDLWSNPFEGREDGVSQTSCCDKRGESEGNTFLIRSITDQNKLRRAKQELVVVKELRNKPEIKWKYGDHCTRPPDHKEHFRQVEWTCGREGIRDKDWKGLYWMETQEEASMSKLNKKKEMCALSVVCKGHTSMEHLRHVKGLENFVLERGGVENVENNTNNSLTKGTIAMELSVCGFSVLQGLDWRTNPFKGGEDGAILISHKLHGLKPMYGSAIPLIMVQLNGQFHDLMGMIYEVLDREKRRTLGTALKQLEQGGFNQLSLTGDIVTTFHVQVGL